MPQRVAGAGGVRVRSSDGGRQIQMFACVTVFSLAMRDSDYQNIYLLLVLVKIMIRAAGRWEVQWVGMIIIRVKKQMQLRPGRVQGPYAVP